MAVSEPISTAAREAIRIAETFVPLDLVRQKALAMEIVNLINRCEAELVAEIQRRIAMGAGERVQ